MELLPGSLSNPLVTPLKKQRCPLLGGPLLLTLVVTVTYSGHQPTCVHLLDNTVNCHAPFTLIVCN